MKTTKSNFCFVDFTLLNHLIKFMEIWLLVRSFACMQLTTFFESLFLSPNFEHFKNKDLNNYTTMSLINVNHKPQVSGMVFFTPTPNGESILCKFVTKLLGGKEEELIL